MFEIPNSAIIAELTTDYDQRTSFLSYRYFFGVMGGVVIGFVTLKYILVPTAGFPNGQLNPAGYVHYGLLAAIVMAGCLLGSVLLARYRYFLCYLLNRTLRRGR